MIRHVSALPFITAFICLAWCQPCVYLAIADDEPPAAATPADPPAKRPKSARAKRAAKPSKATAKEPLSPPRQVQVKLLRQMKSSKPATRVAAVGQLEQYPTAEAARFLTQHGLGSTFADVRQAAYQTLVRLNGQRPVADYVLAEIEKALRRGEAGETTGSLLGVALASKDSQTESRALDLFDKASRRPQDGPLLVLALADTLGLQGDETSLGTLVKMSNRPVFNERFALRRAVVGAMCRIPLAASVDALVKLLSTVAGEVRGDIVRHLTAVTGEQHGLDAEAWTAWWKTHQTEFQFPAGGQHVPSMSQAIKSAPTYYGLPLYAGRIVFILDTSASMAGGRIEAAKRELTTAILSLPDGVYFSVLAFDIAVQPWSEEMLLASQENKAAAVAFVLSRGLGPATASYDALRAAFEFDTESIYFLTDGEPAGGAINDPTQIIALLTQMNQTRRLTINSIGIGVGPPGLINPFDTFLSVLAKSNYGEYRRVDQ